MIAFYDSDVYLAIALIAFSVGWILADLSSPGRRRGKLTREQGRSGPR